VGVAATVAVAGACGASAQAEKSNPHAVSSNPVVPLMLFSFGGTPL
jgi:hypothetical protein